MMKLPTKLLLIAAAIEVATVAELKGEGRGGKRDGE